MVIALYMEDVYGKEINIRKTKKMILELSANLGKGDIYIFKKVKEIVGYAIIIYYWSNEYGGHIVFIDELYIKPQFRGKGIVTQFLQFIITKNKSNIKALQLEVTGVNKRAINFYKKNGFIMNLNQSVIKRL